MKTKLVLVLAALFLTTAAMADTSVTYSTSGVFSGTGAAGNVLHLGSDTITFTGKPLGTPTTLISTGAPLYDFGYPQLGSFKEVGNTNASTNGTQTFTLNIFQTAPGIGSATQVGSLKGTLVKFGSTLTLTFGTPTFIWSANNAKYSTFAGSPIDHVNWAVVHAVTINNQGVTTLQGFAQTAPEPSSLLLLGAGMFGLVGTLRRRK